MKNLIYYFSGTGNSLRAAQIIAEALGDCEVLHINRLSALPAGCGRVGFTFPHYALGVPGLVRRRLEGMEAAASKDAYFFAVETCGGFPGNCLAQVRDILKPKGAALCYGKVVMMPANNVVNYDMKDNAAEIAAAAEETLRQIAGEIAAGTRNKIPRTKHIESLIYRRIVATYPKKGLGFHADGNCTGCGQCARICPAGNIAMQDDRPAFGAKCEQCVACIQWCPQAAIQYKEETQARKRYRHPQVTLREFISKQGG